MVYSNIVILYIVLQVITTLERAIECSQKDAVAFATSIDREGRCIVKCANFQQCSHTKALMEKHTSRGAISKPLKVQVGITIRSIYDCC